jgi:hypothetical protein
MAEDSGWSCGPGCECNERLGRFQEVLSDEDMRFTPEEIQAMEDVIYCKLRCVERHCPDQIVKLYASTQLLNPWWDFQKSREVQG